MRTQYLFQAEPIVLETTNESALKPGDVVEAVNGYPIMTQAGPDDFTYPPAGRLTLTARRGGTRVVLEVTRMGACAAKPEEPVSANQPPKPSYAATRTEQPIIIIDGFPLATASSEPKADFFWGIGQYGFAIGCVPSCTRTKASDGTQYYKFDGYPPIVAVVAGGAAERAGLRVGDIVTQIDGKSILAEEGALRFFRGSKSETMHVTATRNGRQVGYLLKALVGLWRARDAACRPISSGGRRTAIATR
jgi:membrane-associated protease RseP (regulator of RpoE activity)